MSSLVPAPISGISGCAAQAGMDTAGSLDSKLEQAVAGVEGPAEIFRTASLVLASSGASETASPAWHPPQQQQEPGHLQAELLHTALCAALSEPVLLSEAARRADSSPLMCLSSSTTTDSGRTSSSSLSLRAAGSCLPSPQTDRSTGSALLPPRASWATAPQGQELGSSSMPPAGWSAAAPTSRDAAAATGQLARSYSATLLPPRHRSKRLAVRPCHSAAQLMQLLPALTATPPSSPRRQRRRLTQQVSAEQQHSMDLDMVPADDEPLTCWGQGLQQLQRQGGSNHRPGVPSDALNELLASPGQLALAAQSAQHGRMQLQEGAGGLLVQDDQRLLWSIAQAAAAPAAAPVLQQAGLLRQQQDQALQRQASLSPESAVMLRRLQDALRRCAGRGGQAALG